ncbi:MAG: toprim domain-containing protein [Deltaproteobacteria bacterium]|nr:toprim domain-containing protein [Deltaproteobacteria bacterium]
MFSELNAAMSNSGIDPTNAPMIADGKLRRFYLPSDRKQSKNGYLTLHDNGDGTYGACFGSWKHGIKETWFNGKPQREMSKAERREYAQKMAERRRQQEEEQRQRHVAAANKARKLWQQAKSAIPQHPYLVRKQIKPYGLRQLNNALVVSVFNVKGNLTGLQFIQPDGSKKFLSGTEVGGCYHSIGTAPVDVLLFAEGFATGATLYEATGHPVAVCFSAGNLKPVALTLRKKYPTITMVICADADDAGRSAAKEAATAVNGTWIEPDFSEKENT